MNTIAERLKWARQQRGLTQAQLAAAARVSTSAIGNVESGIRDRPRDLLAIARALQTSPTWLESGKGEWDSTPTPGSLVASAPHQMPVEGGGDPDLVITQYDAGGAMGRGFELEDNPPGFIKSWRVDRRWLQLNVPVYTSFENLCIVTGFGPSMKPRYNPGDPLLCDRGVNTVDIDGVYFFRVGRHGFIKQLQRIPTRDGIVLRAKSFNPDYDPFEIDESMDFQVFGKILTAWKSEQF